MSTTRKQADEDCIVMVECICNYCNCYDLVQ